MLLSALRSQRLLAIVRGTEAAAALQTVMTLAEEGIGLVEVSLTTPQALSVISRASRELGTRALVGAGTVITAQDAASAADAGAAFIVTPAVVPAIGVAAGRGLPVVAGALTPTEVVRATQEGAEAVKLFPASLGGVRYLRALLDPLPGTAFVPVGGVDAGAAREYLAAGAIAVGVGSPLIAGAASGGPLSGLRERARQFRQAVGAGEPS
jgi:2-dehydro-3-deoxyphosphogluconate aldolase / (4S)-4-hydroxy-2-oxoglutarate aldolase